MRRHKHPEQPVPGELDQLQALLATLPDPKDHLSSVDTLRYARRELEEVYWQTLFSGMRGRPGRSQAIALARRLRPIAHLSAVDLLTTVESWAERHPYWYIATTDAHTYESQLRGAHFCSDHPQEGMVICTGSEFYRSAAGPEALLIHQAATNTLQALQSGSGFECEMQASLAREQLSVLLAAHQELRSALEFLVQEEDARALGLSGGSTLASARLSVEQIRMSIHRGCAALIHLGEVVQATLLATQQAQQVEEAALRRIASTAPPSASLLLDELSAGILDESSPLNQAFADLISRARLRKEHFQESA